MTNIENIASYLASKGIAFAVSANYETKEMKIVGIKIEKKGKFFLANGTVISTNMAKAI